jgi:hypothetical protein
MEFILALLNGGGPRVLVERAANRCRLWLPAHDSARFGPRGRGVMFVENRFSWRLGTIWGFRTSALRRSFLRAAGFNGRKAVFRPLSARKPPNCNLHTLQYPVLHRLLGASGGGKYLLPL